MSRIVCRIFGVLLLFAGLAPALRSQQNLPAELIQYPELIIHNGKIVTMDDASLGNSIGREYD